MRSCETGCGAEPTAPERPKDGCLQHAGVLGPGTCTDGSIMRSPPSAFSYCIGPCTTAHAVTPLACSRPLSLFLSLSLSFSLSLSLLNIDSTSFGKVMNAMSFVAVSGKKADLIQRIIASLPPPPAEKVVDDEEEVGDEGGEEAPASGSTDQGGLPSTEGSDDGGGVGPGGCHLRFVSSQGSARTATTGAWGALLQGLAPDGGVLTPSSYPLLPLELLASRSWAEDEFGEFAGQMMGIWMNDPSPKRRDGQPPVSGDELPGLVSASLSGTAAESGVTITGSGHEGGDAAACIHDTAWASPLAALLVRAHAARGGRITAVASGTPVVARALASSPGCDGGAPPPGVACAVVGGDGVRTIRGGGEWQLTIEVGADAAALTARALCADERMARQYGLVSVDPGVNVGSMLLLVSAVAYAYFATMPSTPNAGHTPLVDLVVPSGDADLACASLYARRMGLPVRRILVGNEGGCGGWLEALGGSGDGEVGQIEWCGGLERIVYEVSGRDAGTAAEWAQWGGRALKNIDNKASQLGFYPLGDRDEGDVVRRIVLTRGSAEEERIEESNEEEKKGRRRERVGDLYEAKDAIKLWLGAFKRLHFSGSMCVAALNHLKRLGGIPPQYLKVRTSEISEAFALALCDVHSMLTTKDTVLAAGALAHHVRRARKGFPPTLQEGVASHFNR